MPEYDTDTPTHDIVRELARVFDASLDFISDNDDDDVASSILVLRGGVSVEVFHSADVGRDTIIADVVEPDGTITYFPRYQDFHTQRERAVRDITALVERVLQRMSDQQVEHALQRSSQQQVDTD